MSSSLPDPPLSAAEARALFARPVRKCVLLGLAYLLTLYCIKLVHYPSPLPPPLPIEDVDTHFDSLKALGHLKNITSQPHPWNSRANQQVREYLSKQLNKLAKLAAKKGKNLQILPSSDAALSVNSSDFYWLLHDTNLVVRLQGQKQSNHSFLLSCHYDSVPTGYGATDDGVAVAVALEVLRALLYDDSLNYDLLINFNNGEELNLLGSKLFVQTEWSKTVKGFLNMEGTGPGGRPTVFQAGSLEQLQLYQKVVPFPHANVIGNDAFRWGLIRSETDYSVYRNYYNGMDSAFYRNRALYHTARDNFDAVSPRSVHEAGCNALAYVRAVLTDPRFLPNAKYEADPGLLVYYDILGKVLVVHSAQEFLLFQVAALLFATIVLLWVARRRGSRLSLLHHEDYSMRQSLRSIFKSWLLIYGSIILVALVSIVFMVVVWMFNHLIVYRDPYMVATAQIITMLTALPLITQLFPNAILSVAYWYSAGVVALWWLSVFIAALLAWGLNLGFGYPFAWYLVGSSMALLIEEAAYPSRTALLRGYQPLASAISSGSGKTWYFSFGLFFSVIIPTLIFGDLFANTMEAFRYTLADGSSALFVYWFIAKSTGILLLPALPILLTLTISSAAPVTNGSSSRRLVLRRRGPSFKNNFYHIPLLLVVLFLLALVFRYPYSTTSPVKFFFAQTLDLDSKIQTTKLTSSSLSGLKALFGASPSLTGAACVRPRRIPDKRFRLYECNYTGAVPRFLHPNPLVALNSTADHTVVIQPEESSLFCSVEFDQPRNISAFMYSEEDEEPYRILEGVKELNVILKEWGGGFVVALNDFDQLGGAGIDVSCYYDDKDVVRAYGQLEEQLVPWATVANWDASLLTVSTKKQI